MWKKLEREMSHGVIHENQSDQVVFLLNMYKISYDNRKRLLPSLCLQSERLSFVTCEQRADHFTQIMWFDFIRWRFHFIRGRFPYSDCIKYIDVCYYYGFFAIVLLAPYIEIPIKPIKLIDGGTDSKQEVYFMFILRYQALRMHALYSAKACMCELLE